MFGKYVYYEGADGRRYCWESEPTFRCPVGAIERDPIAEDFGYVLTAPIIAAADKLAIDPQFLAGKLKHSPERTRVDGRLTDDCNSCGHRMERLGYRYWIMAKEAESAASEANRRVADRLGFNADGFVIVDGSWYAKTRKDAKAWAWNRVTLTRKQKAVV